MLAAQRPQFEYIHLSYLKKIKMRTTTFIWTRWREKGREREKDREKKKTERKKMKPDRIDRKPIWAQSEYSQMKCSRIKCYSSVSVLLWFFSRNFISVLFFGVGSFLLRQSQVNNKRKNTFLCLSLEGEMEKRNWWNDEITKKFVWRCAYHLQWTHHIHIRITLFWPLLCLTSTKRSRRKQNTCQCWCLYFVFVFQRITSDNSTNTSSPLHCVEKVSEQTKQNKTKRDEQELLWVPLSALSMVGGKTNKVNILMQRNL